MQEGQDKIYYLIAENHQAATSSPHLEIFKKKGIEVLILSDRVDEWLVSHLTEFDGKTLQSVAKGDLSLDKEEEEANKDALEEQKKDFESVMKQMQEVLKDQVKEVRLTSRLVDSPACLVSEDDQMSSHLQRMMRDAGQEVPDAQPIMEINAEHGMIAKLKDETDDARFGDLAHVIFDQALLSEGGKLKDPAKFVQRLNALLVEAL
jgi:molecular chaperone HtpG